MKFLMIIMKTPSKEISQETWNNTGHNQLKLVKKREMAQLSYSLKPDISAKIDLELKGMFLMSVKLKNQEMMKVNK